MQATKTLGKYKITYKNGFIQYKDLISYNDYETIIKPSNDKILDLEYLLSAKNKKEISSKIHSIKQELKQQFGDNWFLDKSPLYDAIKTGILSLPSHQGGDHKIKVELV